MNKKFITLCVSALLAGGMVTPAFAQITNLNYANEKAPITHTTDLSNYKSDQYYVLKVNSSTPVDYGNGSLELTRVNGNLEIDVVSGEKAVTVYNLWKVMPVTVNGVPNGNFTLENMAGFKLGVNDDGSIAVNGEYQEFGLNTISGNLKLVVKEKNLWLGRGTDGKPAFLSGSTNSWNVQFFAPAVDELDVNELNDKFLSSFTIGVGYIDGDKGWKDYAVEHNLQGNVFTGDLKASVEDNLGSTGSYQFKQTFNPSSTSYDKEVYLWSGDKIVVLTNKKWSSLNNSLNEETGYKFTLMTPTELANQEYKDANESDASKRVIRSYVFKVTSPNVVADGALEFAAKVYDYTTETFTAWEELYVSEVNDNYYLTTALAANETTETNKLYLNQADYTDKRVYVRFTENNYVDAERFFSYAWNIVRLNDGKTISPKGNAWVDKETVGPTVPEGQWILVENANADGYEWVNRETTINQDKQLDSDGDIATGFYLNGLRETNSNDEYNGINIYRIGEGTNAKYYSITKAKNGEGVEINLDAADRFDYFGLDAKQTSTGIEQTYKIQFKNDITDEVVYLSQNSVGQLLLTADPTAAIQFHVDTMKTTDNIVVVTDDDINANADVFNIVNTYIGKNDKDEWDYAKKDTVSFYRYNFKYAGKYLHFDANQGYVLADPKSEAYENVPVTEYADAFIIKEKGDGFVNILNTVKADFDAFTAGSTNNLYGDSGEKILGNGDLANTVLGEKVLAADSTQMMYFDFNFAEARQQQNIYNWVANAQLKLDYQNYDIYRNVAPTAPDTMAIYRTEFDDEFMYERGEFLGVTYDRNGYNAALFIDTAYVRNNTEKPLFMIGVRPEITPEYVYCPEHGPNAGCPSQHLDTIPGYVDADYLTVLADSAAYHAAELQNPFLDDNAYTKLAFVAARHNVDTITVADSGAKATIVEGMQHPMVFAFRYVDHETGDFIIEGVNLKNNKKEFDAKENPYVTSYIRWNNGVPVMTENINDAEVFNIANLDETADPTANEAITAEEGAVSVVATEGGVIVKGAEGKNVVVATILGKVVANETVNSDNETINTPAGIVVVSVDGESFKVVVK